MKLATVAFLRGSRGVMPQNSGGLLGLATQLPYAKMQGHG